MKATIFYADGRTESIEADIPQTPGYDNLKTILDPIFGALSWEHVTVLHDNRIMDMFVDECGHLKGMPRNEAATAIYRNATMSGRTGMGIPSDPEMLPFIVGTAVLFDQRVWF